MLKDEKLILLYVETDFVFKQIIYFQISGKLTTATALHNIRCMTNAEMVWNVWVYSTKLSPN
jgi:hypothetical protein